MYIYGVINSNRDIPDKTTNSYAIAVLFALTVVFSSCTNGLEFTIYNKKLWAERVAPIVEGCETDYEKAKAIYDWMSENIIYDYTYSVYSAETCWEKRTGVCEAFSDLYVNLAKGCDLSAEKIKGICRNSDESDGTGGHAWNKVRTEKGWILLDVTWGSCYGHVGDFYNGNSRIWFDVFPDWMIFTHFPNNSHNQLKSIPLSRNDYLSLPNVIPTLGLWGWEAGTTLTYYLQHPQAIAPITYAIKNYCWDTNVFLEYPCSMEEGREYTIRIRNLNPEYPPSGNFWDVEGNVYSCMATAGFTLYVGGCSIIHYPSASKSEPEDGFRSIVYPCE